jgi:D-amino-acid dehydrogenase
MRVVVVGAGILGASAAWHLARAGAEVVLADAAHPGRSTAAAAGIVSPWCARVHDAAWYQLARNGARFYAELITDLAQEGETDTGYRRVGALVVSADAAELDAMERLVLQRRAEAPEAGEIRRLTPAASRLLFPPLRPDLAALLVSGGARVNGRNLAAALVRAAQRRGATLRPGKAALRARGGRIVGITTAGRDIDADVVILATGAWALGLLAPFAVPLPVAPHRGQLVHLRLPGVETQAWANVLPMSDHYLLAFEDSRVVVGDSCETDAGFDYRATAGGQAQVLRDALAVAPGLAQATILETRVGFQPMAAGGRPLLGAIDRLPGLLIANGLGAYGLCIGPYAGRLMAELVMAGRASLDLAPYDPLGAPRPAPVAPEPDAI